MSRRREGRAIHWAEAFGLSAAVHVGVVFFALDFINDIRFIPDSEEERPDLLVTSLVLDADTLAAATQVAPETAPGTLDEPEPDVAEEVEPDTLTATPVEEEPETEPEPEPATEAEPEPEEITELEPETPEVPEAETPEAVEPEAELPETVEAETLTPDVGEETAEALEPVAPAALTPEPLSPLRPQNDTLTALAPVGTGTTAATLAPATPDVAPAAVQPLAATTVERVAPRVTRPQLSPAVPTVAPPPPPPPGSPAAVVGELVSKIRANVGEPCLVAVPQMAADGAPELVMLSSSETAMNAFADNVLEGVDPPPGNRSVLVDERQCEALNYVRANPAYPAFRLSVGLATDALTGEAQLQGAISRAGGAYVSLLLVDDNGVVQDLNTYLTFAGGEARFDVPMRRAGNPRDTKQLLIAIATNSRPRTIDIQNGQEASVFFQALREEMGSNLPIVMIPFDVR